MAAAHKRDCTVIKTEERGQEPKNKCVGRSKAIALLTKDQTTRLEPVIQGPAGSFHANNPHPSSQIEKAASLMHLLCENGTRTKPIGTPARDSATRD
jgi:hypothetical protein